MPDPEPLPGSEKWGQFYKTGAGNLYPDENLVRIVRGKYAEVPRAGRVLDVGFGRGANLVMLAQSGYEAHGLEVSQESVDAGRRLASEAGVQLHLGLLTGTQLGFADATFDLVISWNAVYYHGSRTLVRQAIREFHRVLKPEGVLLMSVIHPDSHLASRLSGDLGDGAHRIETASRHDTRLGIQIFFDGTAGGWHELLSDFPQVKEGRAEIDLFVAERRDAWRLFWARKA
jgi:SAM-dependent methyltransferase